MIIYSEQSRSSFQPCVMIDPLNPPKILELIAELGLEQSPSSSQPPGYQRCKRKYLEIIRERAEGTTMIAQTENHKLRHPRHPKQQAPRWPACWKTRRKRKSQGSSTQAWTSTKMILYYLTFAHVKPISEILHPANPGTCFTVKLYVVVTLAPTGMKAHFI